MQGQLLGEEWRQWAEIVSARLHEAASTDDAVAALAETIVARPLFCDLLSQVSNTLERNVSVPAARTFKRAVHDRLAEIGAEIARATDLTEREGHELAAAACGLAGMLYPAANPSPALTQVYAEDPELAASHPQLPTTLARMLAALAAGFPTLRDDPRR